MPQFATAVLQDRRTPVGDHTFKPRDITGGIATMVEATSAPIGDRKITLSQTRPSSGRTKIMIKVQVPVVQDTVVNGVSRPELLRTDYGEISLNFSNSSTRDERNDVLAFLAEILDPSNTMFAGYTADLEGLF